MWVCVRVCLCVCVCVLYVCVCFVFVCVFKPLPTRNPTANSPNQCENATPTSERNGANFFLPSSSPCSLLLRIPTEGDSRPLDCLIDIRKDTECMKRRYFR